MAMTSASRTRGNYAKFVSTRPLTSLTLRSTLGSSLVNELRGGTTYGGASYFGQMSSNGPSTFADTDGYALELVDQRQ